MLTFDLAQSQMGQTQNFQSDTDSAVAPEIMQALVEASLEVPHSYGADRFTRSLNAVFSDLFEYEVEVFPVLTGSAANALALSTFMPSYGLVFSHEHGHIHEQECGAPECFSGGGRVVGLPGPNGKLDPDILIDAMQESTVPDVHYMNPVAIGVAQPTDFGTVYSPTELQALSEVAKSYGLRFHMDGARIANAVASLGCSPADITWRAGVDVLSFGGTKNGCLFGEAVVFFDKTLAKDFASRRKRVAQFASKLWSVPAQLAAYVADDLWLRNARHANRMAARLAHGLRDIPDIEFLHPVDANEIFIQLPDTLRDKLLERGFLFHSFRIRKVPFSRLVTSFHTSEHEVDGLLEAARELHRMGYVGVS